ncbi:uncharacterized protein PGTG_12445 [Puccinia graminis f. sp. tritici CRL 75-36-700-3]|uniref:Transcription and mRNA export factor SUS1 n=1 Tax=Puccinia graminis f. sp. tritici (strain CRL 75-36-700-3 / race SCCL) TaxID=418459 RepID=E3KQB4_PUCGT|nr:uncharacterized protein PGTG_12445 [Puccinia graminis f. sp. tritici CRL 75-36-700-3]EFP86489.1 hypothetical protein PGTG_12445 [Puccinia graminis f. sp. tritici CRL 75-36-700-3]
MNPVSKKLKPNNTRADGPAREEDEEDSEHERKSVEESITTQLKNRMLASGEWLRLQKILMVKLKGSEWEEQLRCAAETRALEPDNPTLTKLIHHLRPIAQNTIPSEIKHEISTSIEQFIRANIEEEDDDDDADHQQLQNNNDDDDDEEEEDEEAMEEVV